MSKTAKISSLLLSLGAAAVVAIYGLGLAQADKPNVGIGMLLPLGTDTGQDARMGAQTALVDLNDRYGSSLVFEAHWEDSQAEPVTTGTRMEKLASRAGVLGVVGPINSGPATAAADIANREGVVLVSPLASTPALAKPEDFFFRTFPSDAREAKFTARFAVEQLDLKNLVVLNIGAAYGQGLAKAFVKHLRDFKGSVVDRIEYAPDTQNFGSLIERIKGHDPDALYFVGYPPDIAEVLRELRSRRVGFPVLSAAIISDPSVIKLAGENVEGVIFPLPSTYQESGGPPTMVEFRETYNERFEEEPSFVAAQAYDATILIGDAIARAYESAGEIPKRKDVREQIESSGEISGATGKFRLDVNGDAIREYQMFTIRNGSIVPYDSN